MDTGYLRSLKTALVGTPDCRLVMVCNMEAEAQWAQGHVGLPAPVLSTSTALIRRMEELGALLGGPGDVLVCQHPLDPDYRSYLADLGLPPPAVLVPENRVAGRTTAQDALASPRLLERLAALAAAGAHLLPMGTTHHEQRLAEVTGLPLAVADAATFERVNSKIYGRRLVDEAGLRAVPGDCCTTVGELAAVLRRYGPRLGEELSIVVKDAYGVSGKGLIVLDSATKAARLLRMAERRAARGGDPRLEIVVEEWLPKRCDLNYQLTIDWDGCVTLDFVKQALTDDGVHKGHLIPAELTPAKHAEISDAAAAIGKRLYADGFRGVAGVDAIAGADGTLYPALEINARLNMSTYQGSVVERWQPPGHPVLARHYPLRLDGPRTFRQLRAALGPILEPAPDRRFIVACFGTVNANAHTPPPFAGRLYAVLVAADHRGLGELDRAAQHALTRFAPVESAPVESVPVEEDR